MTFEEQLAAGEQAAERYALSVPRTLAQGLGGTRLGRRSGSSLEFQEYRDYQPGDDLRHLDWSAYARSDRLVVKLFHEEVDPHLDLLIDGSRSMALPGDAGKEAVESVKAAATAGLAALVAQAAGHAGFTHAAWLAADGCRRLAPPGEGARSWQLDFAFRGSLGDAFIRLPPEMRRRGLRLLISDLLARDEPRAVVDRLAQGAAAVVVVQLLARDDAVAPAPGFYRLVDSESGATRDVLVDAAAARRYAAAVSAHREAWRRACREVGAVLVCLLAEDLLEGGHFSPPALAALVEAGVLELR